jgi:glutamate-ammonia-ligase adenylyltransferase
MDPNRLLSRSTSTRFRNNLDRPPIFIQQRQRFSSRIINNSHVEDDEEENFTADISDSTTTNQQQQQQRGFPTLIRHMSEPLKLEHEDFAPLAKAASDGAALPRNSTKNCAFCEALRKKGKFPRKCIHKTESKPAGIGLSVKGLRRPSKKNLVDPVETKVQGETSPGLKKVSSLSKMFPEIGNNIPPSFYTGLNESEPTRCTIDVYKPGRAKIQIAVFDISGALLVVTGLFTAFKLDIRRGSVLRKKKLRSIVALFYVSFDESDPNAISKTERQELFQTELNLLWSILKANRNEAVQRLLLTTLHVPSKVTQSSKIRKLKMSLGSSDDESDTQMLSDPEYSSHSFSDSAGEAELLENGSIPCSVKAEDTIGFLFFLSTALTLRDLDIDGIVVDGDEVNVNDLFFLSPNALNMYSQQSLESQTWTIKDEIQTAVTILQSFTQVLSLAPDPSQALRNFDQLLSTLERNSMISEVHQMMHEQILKRLALILGSSSFLWEGFLQTGYAENFDVLKDDMKALESEVITREEYSRRLREAIRETNSSLNSLSAQEELTNLAGCFSRFKSKELFRIYIKHLLCPNITYFSRDLNSLAEALLECAIEVTQVYIDKQGSSSWPLNSRGERYKLAIFGLGKFGGMEMGFASDLDMVCIYDSGVPNEDESEASVYFPEFVKTLFKLMVDRSSRIGSAFDIDLRLRPHGSNGLEATSFSVFNLYYNVTGDAQQFERQSLIRLRYVAGDKDLGVQIESARDNYVYSSELIDLDYATHLRRRQRDELCTIGKVNVKYSKGGLIDIEYGVQYWQLVYGYSNASLRNHNVLTVLEAVHALGQITADEYEKVREAYIVLRHLIDGLRLVRGISSDVNLPLMESSDPEFVALAKRLGYWNDPNNSHQDLIKKIEAAMQTASQFFDSVVERLRPQTMQSPTPVLETSQSL